MRKIYARDAIGARYQPRENGTLPDRLMFPVLDSHAQPEVRAGRAPNSSPETREREAVGKVSSIFSDAGQYGWGFNAPVAGRYRVRLEGLLGLGERRRIGRWFYEGQGAEKSPVYWLPVWHRPNADEIWPGRNNEPIGFYAQTPGQTRPIGSWTSRPSRRVGEIEVQLAGGEGIPHRCDAALPHARQRQRRAVRAIRSRRRRACPDTPCSGWKSPGPLKDRPFATSGYKLLFGDLPMRRLADGREGRCAPRDRGAVTTFRPSAVSTAAAAFGPGALACVPQPHQST